MLGLARLTLKALIALFLIPFTAVYALVLLLTPDERERKTNKSGFTATAQPGKSAPPPHQDWQTPPRA